jgi:hypothetical protein
LDTFATRHRRSIGVCLLTAVLVAGTIIGTAVGLKRLRAYVLSRPHYAANVARVELVDRPEWMNPWLEQTLCDEFLEREEGQPWTFDENLARRIYTVAQQCPWIRTLHEVRIDRARNGATDRDYSQGVIRIVADWRKPVAVATCESRGSIREEYIDAEGVVLPKEQVLSKEWMPRIAGVRTTPPPAGEKWGGDDLQAGLLLVAELSTRAYYGEVTVIDVGNHNNRMNLADPAIRLYANARGVTTEIRFGRLPLSGPPIGEPTTRRKLGYLDEYYNRCSTLVGHQFLELRRETLSVSPN